MSRMSFFLSRAYDRVADLEAAATDFQAVGFDTRSDYEQALRDAVYELYCQQRCEEAYDRAHSIAMEDMTGQDLDVFYGEDC